MLLTKWEPHKGPQKQFHGSIADELLYGGAAGGGKSESLLVEAARYVHLAGYRALLLRRTYPELEGKGSGVISRSLELFHGWGRFDKTQRIWFFPSGATIAFGHLENLQSVHEYRSAQFAYIGFDELTTFIEPQYIYMLSRVRSAAGIPARVRSASNPGGIGHVWVRRRFVDKLKPGQVRWFKRTTDAPVWAGRDGGRRTTEAVGSEVECEPNDPDGMSRQYIPAKVFDNPTLLAKDPGYIRRLKALDPVDRARLLDGDWYMANSGTVYRDFDDNNIVDTEPAKDQPIELAFDDGYQDPRVILFIQRTGTEVLIFDELYHSHHLGETCVAEVIERCAAKGWPLPQLAVGSPEAIDLRERFRRANIGVRHDKTPIVEGIKQVRRLVNDGNGYRTLKVHRRCTNFLGEIQGGYQYPAGGSTHENEEPLDQDNHAMDAMRYWVWVRARRA